MHGDPDSYVWTDDSVIPFAVIGPAGLTEDGGDYENWGEFDGVLFFDATLESEIAISFWDRTWDPARHIRVAGSIVELGLKRA